MSALEVEDGGTKRPPITRTPRLPRRSTAVWPALGLLIDPAADHVPVAGLYRSALDCGVSSATKPPVTSTLPSGRRTVAHSASLLGAVIEPVALQAPLCGSYSSAMLVRMPPADPNPTSPPATSTLPSSRSAAAC